MNELFAKLVARLSTDAVRTSRVIPWSSPVPVFGNVRTAHTATLGLNPSNREFVDEKGLELDGAQRRFHTLRSLGLTTWAHAREEHVRMLVDSCLRYFVTNPYDGWFRRLENIIGTRASFYGATPTACHLDLIPYATAEKWTELRPQERAALLNVAGDTLGLLLRDSSIRVLLLNGRSVVEHFEELAGVTLRARPVDAWTLPRARTQAVAGYSYRGSFSTFGSIQLGREITVLGYNHNIQSSFGVTTAVTSAIREWFGRAAKEALA